MKLRLTVSSEEAERVRWNIYRFISACDGDTRRDPPYVGLTFSPIGDGWDCRLELDDGEVDEPGLARFSAFLVGCGQSLEIDDEGAARLIS